MQQKHPSRRAVIAAGAASLLALPASRAQADCGGFTLEQYTEYLELFNANDPAFISYYHDDVVLELGATATVETPQGILDFYALVKEHVHEHVELGHFVADATGVAVEVPTEFRVYRDWDDSIFGGRSLRVGEVFRIVNFALYRVEDGRFRHIRTARYRTINDWRMEG